MRKLFLSLALVLTGTLAMAQQDSRYFELRIYYCFPGKLDALIQRFQDHTTRIFEKHGMENIGYWVPVNNEKNALYYILAYPSKAARQASWTAFGSDAEWKDVAAKSEVNGKIVESVVSVFMTASDILPKINAGITNPERAFELRTYFCLPGRLPNLVTRFKDHTLKLFQRHHMESIAYFLTEEPDGGQSNLIYMLAFPSVDEAAKSWAAFRADPDWIKAKEASEADGKILVKFESVFLKPLIFSKIK